MNYGKVTVLYHRDNDGFGAAYAIYKAGLDVIKYISVQYYEDVPKIPGTTETLIIVDFSYPKEALLKLAQKYYVIVIDHHKTSYDELVKNRVSELDINSLHIVFDLEKSGAVITWEYFNPDKDVPTILKYVQDYDLWQHELPGTHFVNNHIFTLAKEFYVWDNFDFSEAITRGEGIQAFKAKQLRSDMNGVQLVKFAGYEGVPIVNSTANVSELGEMLITKYPEAPFVVIWSLKCTMKEDSKSESRKIYSLRSNGDIDVSEICKRFGGGGHSTAGSFSTIISGTYSYF